MSGKAGSTVDTQKDVTFGDIENASFDKIVGKSSSSYLVMPSWFVREHAHCFHGAVHLQSAGDPGARLWPVNLGFSINRTSASPQVWFSGGWRHYFRHCGVEEGDRMTFTLVAQSSFVVSITRRGHRATA